MPKPNTDDSPARQAARRLRGAHEGRERFRPLPPELAPRTPEAAYAIQDAYVALRAAKYGAKAGYKISLSSAAMRRFVGVDAPQSGVLLEKLLRRSPARVRLADYVHLIVEFEIAVEMAEDLPAADAPFSRERAAKAAGAVMPALELVDDRGADYAELARHPLELIADNGWNEGAVLGKPMPVLETLDLAQARGVATINGKAVGEGVGAAAMGHPYDAVAWIADHLAALGRGLLRGEVVITGSLVTSKPVRAGDHVKFALGGFGEVELDIE
jgi:2-keto-4-pentenoate hydratase